MISDPIRGLSTEANCKRVMMGRTVSTYMVRNRLSGRFETACGDSLVGGKRCGVVSGSRHQRPISTRETCRILCRPPVSPVIEAGRWNSSALSGEAQARRIASRSFVASSGAACLIGGTPPRR
jgi:hypothetical protein